MSILKEMHPQSDFGSWYAFEELQRRLAEAIRSGYVEEVPVMQKHPLTPVENWYRDRVTGEVYSLVPPDFPAAGSWERVDISDVKQTHLSIQ